MTTATTAALGEEIWLCGKAADTRRLHIFSKKAFFESASEASNIIEDTPDHVVAYFLLRATKNRTVGYFVLEKSSGKLISLSDIVGSVTQNPAVMPSVEVEDCSRLQ